MKKEWADWFIEYTNSKKWDRIYKPTNPILKRQYDFLSVSRNEVPFDIELDDYIRKFIGDHQYSNNGYVLIRYGVGDYIGEHTDSYNNTKVTYVCELQSSECGTGLTIDGIPVNEVCYTTKVKHEVKPIKAGTRISLTMFGRNKKQASGLI